MGISANAMFGGGSPQPATPGSYGVLPRGYRLPDGLRLGEVSLQVADLARSLEYYESVLGLRVVDRGEGRASLAPHDEERVLIELVERPGARPAGRRSLLGLYHFAILLPDRASLGRFVRHLAEIGARAGAADHLVSEAFYLQDPDGLGIEVYADRPREGWQRVGRELMMATDPVDAEGLVAEAGDTRWGGMPRGTVMGHVHLHVGELGRAGEFYAEALGFDRTVTRYPGALFLGAGGYHHHLGTNTWAGPSARTPGDEDARLLHWSIELPTAEDVDAVARSLAAGGHETTHGDGGLMTRDPWGTELHVRVA